jgi:hypothetical protein
MKTRSGSISAPSGTKEKAKTIINKAKTRNSKKTRTSPTASSGKQQPELSIAEGIDGMQETQNDPETHVANGITVPFGPKHQTNLFITETILSTQPETSTIPAVPSTSSNTTNEGGNVHGIVDSDKKSKLVYDLY